MAMNLMQKYPALNFVAPFDSAADFAANANIALHPLYHYTFSLVNSFMFMNVQQQSSPSLLSQVVHPSSANPAAPGSLSPLSLHAVTSSSSLSPSLSSAPSLLFHSPSRGKSPSTPNKLHLSSSEQIAFDPLDAVNRVKEQAQKTETNRKEVSQKEQTGNLPIENVNETAIVQKGPLISDALLPRSSSRHSFHVYPVPSQQQAAAKKKKAASMLSPKPQRLRREMWLGELNKEWLVYKDADKDAWNEMREAAAKEKKERFESESYNKEEEEEEKEKEKEKESDELTERTKEDRQDDETKKEEDDQLEEMQSSPSHFQYYNIQRSHRHRDRNHHHKDSSRRHHQKYICPIHSSSSSSRVMFRRRLPLTRTQTVILSQQSQAISSTHHFVPSKKIFVVNALLFDLSNQSISRTKQKPYSSTSSSFSPSSISPSAASSICLMQLMQLTRGINGEVTLNETRCNFHKRYKAPAYSTQPPHSRLPNPALRFLLQGVETQTHPSLCDSGVVTRALVAPSMTNENVEMADTTEKMKRKEVLPKRIGCARALWRRERRLRQENGSTITSTLPHLDSLTPTTSSSSSSSSSY
ncbi:uncharacterized protein MONOS_14460 [Monocercomonoides exilis]|uniref:uncharacterized protein n=1 Tax=Monocercomonoides exilis TaxID=2049356 RepID=UPI00355961BD|nr:hypothetical protein MONOS_14460 [Monocercomonoides exilis]|eukprot:MONOS_14460.1-p1 / transcript=MONOS_14460.1 / gene=MONOS_14460 / organism=Monocercomonoides_exilis_PA203 / gene_product=unspecified product / transcript_product=unspecified product / location=Mono_scaffold01006:6416-8553(-) / protein_length=583 / sequence_SO=supercontig / SO=protein_coding / is_pseudo=false